MILGPDGPTAGGFVVAATVIHADFWKIGQFRPVGDTVRFREVTLEEAIDAERALDEAASTDSRTLEERADGARRSSRRCPGRSTGGRIRRPIRTSTRATRSKPGDVVGLVEIMKSFHEITSDAEGRIARFLVENEDLVDAGQDIIALEPAMSAGGRIDFESIGWEDDQPDIHSRAENALGQRWAMVEYEAGAAREEWCTDGHRGYVLEGEIEYEFDDGTAPLRVARGQGFVPRRRHRAPRAQPRRDGDAALPDRRPGVKFGLFFAVYRGCFRNAFFVLIWSPSSSNRSQPRTRSSLPSGSVATNVHSAAPRSPDTKTSVSAKRPSG